MNDVRIKNIFFRDDFDFILSIVDKLGIDIGWPNFNWSAKFWTSSKANAFVVSCIDGECMHCFPDNGHIHVVFDNHGLSFGDLFYELTLSLPSEFYSDRARDIHISGKLPVRLVAILDDNDYSLGYSDSSDDISSNSPDIPVSGDISADTVSVIVNRAIAQHNAQIKAALSSESLTASVEDISNAASAAFQ